MEGYRKFCNKIFNATKFAMLKLDETFVPEPSAKVRLSCTWLSRGTHRMTSLLARKAWSRDGFCTNSTSLPRRSTNNSRSAISWLRLVLPTTSGCTSCVTCTSYVSLTTTLHTSSYDLIRTIGSYEAHDGRVRTRTDSQVCSADSVHVFGPRLASSSSLHAFRHRGTMATPS